MNTPELAYSEIEKLVKNFKNMPAAQRKGLSEMQTRLGYILPLFKALGWDTSNINEVSPEEKVSRGWVDFSFRLGNIPRFFLETKRANENLNDPKWVKQAIDYAWTKSVTWALLSDFEGLRVFNAEWKESNPFSAQFFELDLDSYLTDFERLWWLSKTEIAARRLDLEAEKVGKKNKRLPVSQNLFDDLRKWREDLFKNYKGYNPVYSPAQIDEAVLRLLNRLIFIRTAEDREVEQVQLRALIRELKDKKQFKNFDRELALLFRKMDTAYNSELFAPHFSEELQIAPSALEDVIEGLYEKNYIRYNFNALDADVLGTAYEQYLGHVVAEIEGGTHVQEKRTKRKSQGIYYTPAFVTRYIVQQTVGRHLEEHGYHPSRPLRVLDMACGSGSFLIEAFDVIDNFVAIQRGQAHKGEMDIHDRARQLEVLQNCIFGVDKDKQAVEVARLNLLLRGLHSREKLPMLENIHYGDSLRPETWEQGFSPILNGGGFDVIIGNPPYVRIQTLDKAEVEFFNQTYQSATGNYDIYVLFVEKALQLLKPGGVMGLILPNKFMQTSYGEGLRKLLSKQKAVLKIINFGDAQVFDNATTYTCMLFLKKTENKSFEYSLAEKWLKEQVAPPQLYDRYLSFVEIKSNHIGVEPWALTGENAKGLMDKLLDKGELFETIASRMFQGIRTSANEIYVLNIVNDNVDVPVLFSKALGRNVRIERRWLKPFLRGEDIKAYRIAKPSQYVLVPYQIDNGKAKLLDTATLKAESPLCWEYLLENRGALENRERGKMKHDNWYAYVYPKNLDQFGRPKLITPDIAPSSSFALDDNGFYSFVSGYGIVLNDNVPYDLKYILGLLNSRILDFYLKQISSRLQQGFYRYFSQYIEQLPIRRINFDNPAEKAAHDGLVSLVEQMLALHKERQSVRPEDDLDRARNLDRRIAAVDEEIDRRVYELYELTEEEIKVVEGKE